MNRPGATDRREPRKTSRRRLLVTAGAGIGLLAGGSRSGGGESREVQQTLKDGDRIDVGDREENIVQEAYRLGYDYEKRYGGCSQCSVAALQDALPFVTVDEQLFRGASCLDGGATPDGLQNCGAFTGCGMVIGYLCGRTRVKTFQGSTGLSHKLVRQLYERFKSRYGSVLCKDVMEGAKADCPEVVGKATMWTAEILLGEFAKSTKKADQ